MSAKSYSPVLARVARLALAGTWTLIALPCHAATVVVPDDYPTIQGAINSLADSILIRDGTYPEDVTIPRRLWLEPFQPVDDGLRLPAAYPRILGDVRIQSGPPYGPDNGLARGASLRGMWVSGSITFQAWRDHVDIRECRVDSGIVGHGEPWFFSVRGCIVRGGIDFLGVYGVYGEIINNTVLGGGIRTSRLASGCCAQVRGNHVVGPAAVGISMRDVDGGSVVSANTVLACQDGIVVQYPGFNSRITDNLVEGCQGSAFTIVGGGGEPMSSAELSGNAAKGCGGHGFAVFGVPWLRAMGNEAQDCGGDGIWIGGPHPDPNSWGYWRQVVKANRILRAGADGIRTDGRGDVSGNVVGRARGRGIAVQSPADSVVLSGNTSYWNGGAGFDVASDHPTTVANNIAYANQREGLLWGGPGMPTLSCNDWYANVNGATAGISPGPSDLMVDPYFCNVPQDDVHLAVFSPLRNAPGCGLIGALDAGCSEPTAVPEPTLSEAGFTCAPAPSSGELRFSWHSLESAGQLEVFDASGARRWQTPLAKGARGTEWDASDAAGRRLPAGVYFARLTAGSFRATTRVVVIR